MTLVPTPIESSVRETDNEIDDPDEQSTSPLRNVPLRQRHFPASFWQEPNVPPRVPPFYCPTPTTSTYVPLTSSDAYRSVASTVDYSTWYSPSANPTAYNNQPPTPVVPTPQCSCPHCTEKQYRVHATSYPTWPPACPPDSSDMKAAAAAAATSWMLSTPTSPKSAAGTSTYHQAYHPQPSPYSNSFPSSNMEVGSDYVHHHQAGASASTIWKTPSATSTYLPMPYHTFN